MHTWGRYQHLCLAAVKTVQQTLGANVVIKQSRRGAQFSQGQPGEDEGGFVAHEKCHGVSSIVPRVGLKGVGNFVAPSLCVRV